MGFGAIPQETTMKSNPICSILRRFLSHAVAVMALLVGATVAQAQLPTPEPSETAQTEAPVDTFERQTPRSSVTALLNALAAEDYERAARYFAGTPDPATLPLDNEGSQATDASEGLAQGADLARKLKLALDSGGMLRPFAVLSNAPDGDLEDGLDPLLEQVGTFQLEDSDQPIILQRVAVGERDLLQWRISPETVSALEDWTPSPEVAEQNEEKAIEVAGAPVLDWLLLIGVAVALFAALRLLAAAIISVLRRLIPEHSSSTVFRLIHAALPPLALYVATIAFFYVAGTMEASIIARQQLLRGAGIAAWLSLGWFLFRLIDAVARMASERMNRAERRQAASVITLLRRIAKLTLLVMIFIGVLDTFGVDVTTGIAALGIGGLALALGAQKTIENLVGSVTIIGDHPVQVGDAAQIGDTFGTVEDVGMRSTRVRTINRTLVTIPNGFLAGEKIENFSARDQFLFKHVIGVSYDTDAEKMSEVLAAFRTILAENDHVLEEDARARFIGFGESALNIEIFAYFRTASFAESLEMQEVLLLALMRKLKELDVEIAFPTRTLHIDAYGSANGRSAPISTARPNQEGNRENGGEM